MRENPTKRHPVQVAEMSLNLDFHGSLQQGVHLAKDRSKLTLRTPYSETKLTVRAWQGMDLLQQVSFLQDKVYLCTGEEYG